MFVQPISEIGSSLLLHPSSFVQAPKIRKREEGKVGWAEDTVSGERRAFCVEILYVAWGQQTTEGMPSRSSMGEI